MTPSGPFQLLDLWLLHSPPPLAPSNPFRHPLATSQSVVAFRLAPLISYSTQYGSSSLFSFSVFLKKLSFEAAFIFEVVFMEIDKPQPINVFILRFSSLWRLSSYSTLSLFLRSFSIMSSYLFLGHLQF